MNVIATVWVVSDVELLTCLERVQSNEAAGTFVIE